MKLLLTQKNDIFDLIVEEGFHPNDFLFTEEVLAEIVTYLKFKDTKYYFLFERAFHNQYNVSWIPGEYKLEDNERAKGWKSLLVKIRKWLKNLARENSIINKWELLEKEIRSTPSLFNTTNDSDQFSSQELKLISLKINILKLEFKSLALPEASIHALNEKLDNLLDKADQLSKTDWKELFIGGIIGTIMNLAIPPEAAKTIWDLIHKTFNQLILQ